MNQRQSTRPSSGSCGPATRSLHEWETGKEGKRKLREREGEKADYILKMEEKADRKARAEAEKGTEPPKNLITWVFQDDFIPRAKLTEDGSYSIISDYLGTPVEAYDEEGKKVWERELDIYGRVKRSQKDRFGNTTELAGEEGFIPFRYQGQYEDVETGLYYNRFRYYSPSDGIYTQIDPIGLAGGNPTIYGYVLNPLSQIDLFGLAPTEKWMRDFIREILGTNLHDGGSYFFQTGNKEWYVGKANDFYRRLRSHLGSGKLTENYLETLGVLIKPKGSSKDYLILESEMMKKFKKEGVILSNKIKSPGDKLGAQSSSIKPEGHY